MSNSNKVFGLSFSRNGVSKVVHGIPPEFQGKPYSELQITRTGVLEISEEKKRARLTDKINKLLATIVTEYESNVNDLSGNKTNEEKQTWPRNKEIAIAIDSGTASEEEKSLARMQLDTGQTLEEWARKITMVHVPYVEWVYARAGGIKTRAESALRSINVADGDAYQKYEDAVAGIRLEETAAKQEAKEKKDYLIAAYLSGGE